MEGGRKKSEGGKGEGMEGRVEKATRMTLSYGTEEYDADTNTLASLLSFLPPPPPPLSIYPNSLTFPYLLTFFLSLYQPSLPTPLCLLPLTPLSSPHLLLFASLFFFFSSYLLLHAPLPPPLSLYPPLLPLPDHLSMSAFRPCPA